MYEEIKHQLEISPRARERKNKNRFIAWFLWKKWKLDQEPFSANMLETLIVEASSYDRAWRQVLQHEPSLRGTDYDDKVMVEQEKELELGYQPGFHGDIKKAKTL